MRRLGITTGRRLLWIGFAVFVIGLLVDLAWHSTHEEFETAADQFRAHAVVWIGVLLVLAASARTVAAGVRTAGDVGVALGVTLYVPVTVWHFWEHLKLRDPDPLTCCSSSRTLIIGGVEWIVASRWNRRRAGARSAE